jgi:predicted metal-dependent hydrolase
MHGSFSYGSQIVRYAINQHPELFAKIRIHVHPNATVQVEAPHGIDLPEIKLAVRKRARWIVKQINAALDVQAHALPREYVSGETHFYLGRRYRLRITKSREELSSVKLKGGCIEIVSRTTDPAAIRRRLNDWYGEKSRIYFKDRTREISSKMRWIQATPSVKLVTMKKQWGSCSPKGVINLNPWLARAPRDCIDYVITHELCHLKEHNHSKKFYELLDYQLPNWESVKAKLDGMAELLLAT